MVNKEGEDVLITVKMPISSRIVWYIFYLKEGDGELLAVKLSITASAAVIWGWMSTPGFRPSLKIYGILWVTFLIALNQK